MCSSHEIDKQTEKQAGYKKISWFMGGLTKKRETTHYNFFLKQQHIIFEVRRK